MIDLSPVMVFGLALVRPSLLVMVSSLFGGAYTPTPVKVGLIVTLTVLLAPVIELPQVLDPGLLVVVGMREALIGFSIGLSLRLLVAGAELGGHLSGFQLGLSYAALIDPQSGVRNNVLAALYGSLAVFIFLLINGHHDVLRAFAESYSALPVGTGAVGESLGASVMRMFGMMFLLGVRLAAPLVITLLMVEIALGVLARIAPTLNLMVTAAPIRLLVGWLVLTVTIRMLPDVLTRALPDALVLGARAAAAFR